MSFEDWDSHYDELDAAEPGVHDPKVDEAKIALVDFFEERPLEVFYERQLEVIFENKFFHWITNKALYELREDDRLASELEALEAETSIRFYRAKTHRFWKRQAKEIKLLVRAFSQPSFTEGLGSHGETMFDAALPTGGFLPVARKVREHNGKRWTETNHDLDRLYTRDDVFYGIEIKNTLSYINRRELDVKLRICAYLNVRPLFIVRMAPKSYIFTTQQLGGYTMPFKYQLYPHGYASFARTVRDRLLIPVDSPARIADGTIQRFLNWHRRVAQQTNSYS